MAQVTITGSPEQIAAAISGDDAPSPQKRRKNVSLQRQQAIVARRKIVRRAFDLVRRDPSQRDTVDRLAGVLGGRYSLDQSAIELAERIIETSRVTNGESK